MQCPIQSLDPLRSPGRDVGQGAGLHLAAFAKRLPEQDGRGRSAIGNSRYIHAHYISHIIAKNNAKIVYYMPTIVTINCGYSPVFKHLPHFRMGSSVGAAGLSEPAA